MAACGPASRRSSPCVLLALPAPAGADSILFVRDGNVWISTPDGSTERPLTAGGGYASPSMADDGTIVALRGSSFARLRTDGAAIGMPVQAVGGDWLVASGPFDARVSPDGLKIAYWFSGRRRLCLPIEPGCSLQDSEVAAYAYAGRVTDPLELGAVRERREPSWLGSGRALLFRHGAGTGETVAVNRVGRGESDLQGWFSYDDGTVLDQGQLSRAGDRFAAVAGGNEIHLFGVGAPPPALPALRCVVPGGPFASPTWSPDGSMLAWAGERRRARRRAGPRPARAGARLLGDPRAAAGGGQRPLLGRRRRAGRGGRAGHAAARSPRARRPARAFRSLRVARRQRGRAVRLRLRITRGPARVEARLRRGAGAPGGCCGAARGRARCGCGSRSTAPRGGRSRGAAGCRCASP